MPCVYLPGPAHAVTVANNNFFSDEKKSHDFHANNVHTMHARAMNTNATHVHAAHTHVMHAQVLHAYAVHAPRSSEYIL